MGIGSADVVNLNSGRKGMVLPLGWKGEGITHRTLRPGFPEHVGNVKRDKNWTSWDARLWRAREHF